MKSDIRDTACPSINGVIGLSVLSGFFPLGSREGREVRADLCTLVAASRTHLACRRRIS